MNISFLIEMFPWVYFISSVITQKIIEAVTFSDAQNTREKFLHENNIDKSAENDNSALFKDLICRQVLGTAG